jgi:hypothetical protein
VPITVVPEVTHLLRQRLGPRAEATFLASLTAGEMALQQITHTIDRRHFATVRPQHVAAFELLP